MPIFITLNLFISYVVENDASFRSIISSPWVIYIGLACALGSIAGAFLRRGSERVWYDLFASSALLVWFSYWQPIFGKDSPMFFSFPLYFAGMTVFVSLAFINQRHKIDQETLRQMRRLSEQIGLQSWVIMLCVLGSLELQEHYLVYPVTTTLLLLRFSLSRCIERK